MVVPFAPGGPTDVIARLIAQKLTEAWGHQVVIDNRAGAGGNIGMGMGANAAPDGYTITVVSSSFVVNPGLYAKIPYRPVQELHSGYQRCRITQRIYRASIGACKNDAGYRGADKKRAEEIQLRNAGRRHNARLVGGIVPHDDKGRCGEGAFWRRRAGSHVGDRQPDSARLRCLPPATPHIQGGRLHALAVTSAKRSRALPDVPTMAEAGFKGQEADTLQGLLLPAGTPKTW